nr:MAG: hypothetical protein E4H34_04945 [Hyphomicrobiales bacterium]
MILSLVAIGFQSLIVQPHIHGFETLSQTAVFQPTLLADAADARLVRAAAHTSKDSASGKGDRAPAGTDYKDCSMCQSAHQSGPFLKTATHIFSLPPVTNILTANFNRQAVAGANVSFHWQTRAPPQS